MNKLKAKSWDAWSHTE